MHRTFSRGAIALTFVTSVLVPGITEPALAAETAASYAQPSAPLAIRDTDSSPAPAERLQQIAPPVRIATSTPTLVATSSPTVVKVIRGKASWYGPGFYGRRTANGERFTPGTLTAAHRTLPFGTRVRVTNLHNGRSTVVRINDRGPFHGNRVIDLAHGAATEVGLTASGLAPVKLEVLR